MTIQQAIEKAVTKGWVLRGGFSTYEVQELSIAHPNLRFWYEDGSYPMPSVDVDDSEVLLDPLFWQCLGKAMGWGDNNIVGTQWLVEWHNFIDYLAEGKDISSFFETLT